MKFIEFGKLRTGLPLLFEQNPLSSIRKCKLKNITFDHDDITKPSSDTHTREVINCAKFDVCTPSDFTGVKTHRHTKSIALNSLD